MNEIILPPRCLDGPHEGYTLLIDMPEGCGYPDELFLPLGPDMKVMAVYEWELGDYRHIGYFEPETKRRYELIDE